MNRPCWSITPFLISDNDCMLIILTFVLSNTNLYMVFPIRIKLGLHPLLSNIRRFSKLCSHSHLRWLRSNGNECKFKPTWQLRFQISLSNLSIWLWTSWVSNAIIRSFYMVLDWAHPADSCFGIYNRIIRSLPVRFRSFLVYLHCFVVVLKRFETAVVIWKLAANLKIIINISVWISLEYPLFFWWLSICNIK